MHSQISTNHPLHYAAMGNLPPMPAVQAKNAIEDPQSDTRNNENPSSIFTPVYKKEPHLCTKKYTQNLTPIQHLLIRQFTQFCPPK
jgi:hypothetical protein